VTRLIFALSLVSVSCVMSALQVTPSPSPAPATPSPSATARPTATALTDAVVGVTAYVLPAAVNVRQTANGIPTGLYLYAGDRVFVLGCSGNWCLVEAVIAGEAVVGHVFRGCLSSVAENRLCEAR
jgi:hypothetical protein